MLQLLPFLTACHLSSTRALCLYEEIDVDTGARACVMSHEALQPLPQDEIETSNFIVTTMVLNSWIGHPVLTIKDISLMSLN